MAFRAAVLVVVLVLGAATVRGGWAPRNWQDPDFRCLDQDWVDSLTIGL